MLRSQRQNKISGDYYGILIPNSSNNFPKIFSIPTLINEFKQEAVGLALKSYAQFSYTNLYTPFVHIDFALFDPKC